MSWEIVWDEGLGAVRVTIHGVFTSVEFALMSEAVLSQPYWYPGADVLFDYRDCVIEQGFSEIHSAAESTASAADRIGGGKAALVVANMVGFGTARQYQTLIENSAKISLRPFIEIAEAEAWLRDDPDPA